MSVFEACAVAATICGALALWLLADLVKVHVETQRFWLAKARHEHCEKLPDDSSVVI